MHPAFLPCSFGQMVTTAPAGLTITLFRPDQRHRTVPGPSTVTVTGNRPLARRSRSRSSGPFRNPTCGPHRLLRGAGRTSWKGCP